MHKLNDQIFKKFCSLVYDESGINLTEEKRELLNARIGKRLRKQNVDPDDYFQLIKKDPAELMAFIDAVSTNHTFFFRESKSFSYLENNCSRVWCAAASSGEEPYSIAIYCLEKGIKPFIFATDISDSCLDKGKQGVYTMQSVANIPNHILKSYFKKGQAKWQGYVRVKDDIRKIVDFRRFNLIKDKIPSNVFDIIFCRNVMIYFDSPTKELVVKKLSGALRKDGYFIIGGAESLSGLKHPLKYIEPSVYLKI